MPVAAGALEQPLGGGGEGAPPLPSENLTVDSPITPYKYLAASTVTLTESDDVTYAYTAPREVG